MKKFVITLLFVAMWLSCYAKRGDVDGDGAVTSADITALYNYLLNGDTSSLVNGDVDHDGNITSADVTTVYNILLNGPEPEITEYTVNGVSFKMVDVEGGTFMMGAPSSDSNAESDEKPQHQVTVSSFAIGQTVVTQELWVAVMGSNPSFYEGNKLPIHSVTWNECQNFITALNNLLHVDGYEFAMPTEAQWEFAARGGNLSKGYYYAGSDNIDDVAWYSANSDDMPHEVGKKAPNELGLYDMSGNASEWCSDWKANYTSEAQVDPVGPSSGTYRVGRGGYYSQQARSCRITERMGYRPNGGGTNITLRLVLVPKPIETITVNGVSFNMVNVEGGTFMMGAMDGDEHALDDEFPVHKVTLSNFSIGQTEVTQELWEAVMGSNLSQHVGSNLPVDNVSWNDCQEFITKLNAMTGRDFRLPTESEWEFAARGGNQSKGYLYSGSNNVDEVAWHTNNSGRESQPVGTKAPNELGIYDMSGNVQELCYDWYADQYPSESQVDPIGPATGIARITRGGCWAWYTTDYCRVTFRDNALPGECKQYIGLRLAEGPISKRVFSINGVVFNMIKVDGGTFTMGAADDDTEAYDNERPAHQVTLSDYWIGETEVTEALWIAVMNENPAFSVGDNYPVRRYSNARCKEFASALSQITGKNFALPTEAQWEFAARGGNKSHGYLYAGSNNIDDVAWYVGNSGGTGAYNVHEVATKAPNELDIYDMCGNVAEWVSDDVYYYTAEPQVNPTHPQTSTNNVARDGCWIDEPRDCRVTFRSLTSGSSVWIGFRLAIQN